ncbi:MAG: PAS domain S-box protein [Bacteroidota bacterium]
MAVKKSKLRLIRTNLSKILPHQADEQVRENQLFRLAMEHSAIGLALLDPDGRWLKVNKALCDIVGYTESELLKIDFQTITHPDDLEADLDVVSRLLAGEIETYNLHKRYYHKKGHIIWILLTVSLVRDEHNQPLYFISQIQDRTKEYRNKKNLTRVNEELERLTTQLSHDVRGPLDSSVRVLSLVKEALQTRELATAEKTIELVENQLGKLYMFVSDVLEIAKSRKQEKNQEVYLAAIVGNTLKKFSHMTRFSQISFTQKFEYTKPLRTQRSRMVSMVENLISNAIKYHDVQESHPEITIECFEEDQHVVFQVSDNGYGIDNEHHRDVFKMFKRFHDNNIQGSGVGLYLTKKNIEAMNGTIEFIPLKKGCRFKLNIPKNA